MQMLASSVSHTLSLRLQLSDGLGWVKKRRRFGCMLTVRVKVESKTATRAAGNMETKKIVLRACLFLWVP